MQVTHVGLCMAWSYVVVDMLFLRVPCLVFDLLFVHIVSHYSPDGEPSTHPDGSLLALSMSLFVGGPAFFMR